MEQLSVKKPFPWKRYINYFLIAGLFLVVLLLDLFGALKTSSLNLFTQIAYSMILAVSLNLIVGFLGELSLGHAGFMCVGAYIGCFFANTVYNGIGNPTVVLLISMLVGGLFAALAGLVIGLPTLRLKGDYLAIVTLAFGEIVRTVFKNLPSKWFGGAMGMSTHKYGNKLYIIAFLAVLLTVFVAQNLVRSRQGRAVQAIRDNEIAARSCGINVTYYKLMVFVIAAFFAGIAGVIYGHYVPLVTYSTFSFNYSIDILVMVVLGGMGNITGSLIAATALTVIDVKLTTNLPGDLAALKNLIYALILILIVVWNNAPALRGVREKYNLHTLRLWLVARIFRHGKTEAGDDDVPATAAWDKIPTKIPMDAILSNDLQTEHQAEDVTDGAAQDKKEDDHE